MTHGAHWVNHAHCVHHPITQTPKHGTCCFPLRSQAAHLPAPVLALILQHVDLHERLGSSALVDTSWAEAANLATDSIEVNSVSADDVPALQSWLTKNSKQLMSLQLHQPEGQSRLKLTCADLQQLTTLSLQGGLVPHLQLPDSSTNSPKQKKRRRSSTGRRASGGAGAAAPAAAVHASAVLPHLKELQLHSCTLHSTTTLLQLTSLSAVTSLDLDGLSMASRFTHPVELLSKGVAALLQNLPGLQQLRLGELQLDDSVVPSISNLHTVQHFSFNAEGPVSTGKLLQALPASLTHLSFADSRDDKTWPLQNVPSQLLQLSGLLQLRLQYAHFHPSALCGMTQLQHLQLEDCVILPTWQTSAIEAMQAAVALLLAVGEMQQLQELKLNNVECDAFAHIAADYFANLTASSQLRSFTFSRTNGLQLQDNAFDHMFVHGPGPFLKYYELTSLVFDGHCPAGNEPDTDTNRECCMTPEELFQMCRACPNLRHLALINVLDPDDEVYRSPLWRLVSPTGCGLPSQCTSLVVGGAAFGDAAAEAVRHLRQVQRLTWWGTGLTDAGLEQLFHQQYPDARLGQNALNHLTYLQLLDNPDLSAEVAPVNENGLNNLVLHEVGHPLASRQGGCAEHG